jgi:ArsR family transcriptional regulator, lead/cadmium/zinc/bismuth-responsive transcriptional repressor
VITPSRRADAGVDGQKFGIAGRNPGRHDMIPGLFHDRPSAAPISGHLPSTLVRLAVGCRGVSIGDTFAYVQVSEVTGLDACAVSHVDDERVVTVGASLIDVDEAIDLAEMFRLLGDPTRVRILFALLEGGELCVCDIAAVVGTSDTKVSQAMRLLRGAGVVRNRRDGRNVFYRLDDSHVRMLLDLSREHRAHSGAGA